MGSGTFIGIFLKTITWEYSNGWPAICFEWSLHLFTPGTIWAGTGYPDGMIAWIWRQHCDIVCNHLLHIYIYVINDQAAPVSHLHKNQLRSYKCCTGLVCGVFELLYSHCWLVIANLICGWNRMELEVCQNPLTSWACHYKGVQGWLVAQCTLCNLITAWLGKISSSL